MIRESREISKLILQIKPGPAPKNVTASYVKEEEKKAISKKFAHFV